MSWINSSLLSPQPAKCCSILFTRKRNSKLPPPCIIVEGTPLAIVSSVKYLGLQINSDLSWSPHVAKLCVKAQKLVGLLYRRFGKLAHTATLQLYESIHPHLEYCSVVWDPYHVGDIKLLKVQRFALRVCLKIGLVIGKNCISRAKFLPLLRGDLVPGSITCSKLPIISDFPEPHLSTGPSTTTIDIPILYSSNTSTTTLNTRWLLYHLCPEIIFSL